MDQIEHFEAEIDDEDVEEILRDGVDALDGDGFAAQLS